MNNYSIREVVDQAIQTERLGHQFYTLMCEKFNDNKELNILFKVLAGEELRHEKQFAGLKDKLEELLLDNWEEASKYLRAIVESEFFLGNNKSLPSMETLETVDDAVRYALGFEKETLLYYHSLKDSVGDNAILYEIIEEEKRHIVFLSNFAKLMK